MHPRLDRAPPAARFTLSKTGEGAMDGPIRFDTVAKGKPFARGLAA